MFDTLVLQAGKSTISLQPNDFLLVLEGNGIVRRINHSAYSYCKGSVFGSFQQESLVFESNETLILGRAKLDLGKQYYLEFRRYTPDETELYHKTFLYALSIQASEEKNKKELFPHIMNLLKLSIVQIPRHAQDIPDEIYELLVKSYEHISDHTYDINEEIRKLNYSQDYARKLIVKETGLTPVQFMTNMRIERAITMIQESLRKYTVKDLAFACGYDDEFYFSRQFKKYVGTSPKEYIKTQQPQKNEDGTYGTGIDI